MLQKVNAIEKSLAPLKERLNACQAYEAPCQPTAQQPGRYNTKELCFNCHKPGHVVKNCPKKFSIGASHENQTMQMKCHGTPKYVKVVIDGVRKLALLHSGSDVSVLPTSTISVHKTHPKTRTLIAANNTKIQVKGEVDVLSSILPHEVVNACSVNEFKNKFDVFISMNDSLYDYKQNIIFD